MATEDQVIGQNVRRLRLARGWRQADLAVRMNQAGARWSQTTVSAVETGARACTYFELAALLHAFETDVGQVFAGDDAIDRPDGETVPASWVREAFTRPRDYADLFVTSNAPKPTRVVFEQASIFFDDATEKAARTLGVRPQLVLDAAMELWGKALGARRDEQLGDTTDVPARTVQARRGHITRQLLEELRDHIGRE